MKFGLMVIIFIIGLYSANGYAISHRIVGGRNIDIEDRPYQVSVQVYKYHYCGGAIISESWILSAAHCYSKLAPKDVQVYSGATSIICCGRFTNVDEIITHPNYNKRTHNNDFSLLKLEQPLHFNERTKAIQMVNEEFDVPIGKLGVVSGWGLTQNPKESEKELRAVFVPVISAEQCRAAYDPITPQMICAGYRAGGKDSCKGDSGGPLTMTFDNETLLVGVVSFGDGCARPDFPGVYSNVATARQWIRNVTGV